LNSLEGGRRGPGGQKASESLEGGGEKAKMNPDFSSSSWGQGAKGGGGDRPVPEKGRGKGKEKQKIFLEGRSLGR